MPSVKKVARLHTVAKMQRPKSTLNITFFGLHSEQIFFLYPLEEQKTQ